MKFRTAFNEISMGPGAELVLFAGPCVIEDHNTTLSIARFLKDMARDLGIPFVFKASYDKANRTSLESYRGPGMLEGLQILSSIKNELSIPILSDVHSQLEVESAAQVLDIIQIPAFLCRQTDLILSVARTGKPVNIKKGQFLSPWDMSRVTEKITSTGNHKILLTERGSMFGYSNLVVDFRSIKIMQDIGFPVIFDATHSVQLPGGAGNSSGGQREFAPLLAKAAVAAGADGIFIEVHPDPDRAKCDGPNSLPLTNLHDLIFRLKAIRRLVSEVYAAGN
jgi:2-dehydro-3-deoxyphosphooctonate aldolase (KDO 8-P synthase)